MGGSDLVVVRGKPEDIIPTAIHNAGASAATVIAPKEVTYEELLQEHNLSVKLRNMGNVKLEFIWDYTLHHPEDLSREAGLRIPTIPQPFTKYRNAVESAGNKRGVHVRRPLIAPKKLPPPPNENVDLATLSSLDDATLRALGGNFKDDPRGVMRFEGGEVAGLQRLEGYCKKGLSTYK